MDQQRLLQEEIALFFNAILHCSQLGERQNWIIMDYCKITVSGSNITFWRLHPDVLGGRPYHFLVVLSSVSWSKRDSAVQAQVHPQNSCIEFSLPMLR